LSQPEAKDHQSPGFPGLKKDAEGLRIPIRVGI